jgi:HAD superfamily hydrolase (TIGR01509 family)
MLKGVLFDMDGVLVDSEEFICQAAVQMFAEKGLRVKEEDFLPFVGTGENQYIGGVAEKYGLELDISEAKARTYSIYSELVKGKLQPLPGVHNFIDICKQNNIKIAVATSTDEFKMKVNLNEINLGENIFNSIINGLEVERKKPFPDIFLLAAEKLGLKAEECLVIEDAVSGVEAAKSAGCKCLALTTSFTRRELSRADWICENLATYPVEAINW